jgi:hypothetical protein
MTHQIGHRIKSSRQIQREYAGLSSVGGGQRFAKLPCIADLMKTVSAQDCELCGGICQMLQQRRVCRFDKDGLARNSTVNRQLVRDEVEVDRYVWDYQPTLPNNQAPDFVLLKISPAGQIEFMFPVEGKVSLLFVSKHIDEVQPDRSLHGCAILPVCRLICGFVLMCELHNMCCLCLAVCHRHFHA